MKIYNEFIYFVKNKKNLFLNVFALGSENAPKSASSGRKQINKLSKEYLSPCLEL